MSQKKKILCNISREAWSAFHCKAELFLKDNTNTSLSGIGWVFLGKINGKLYEEESSYDMGYTRKGVAGSQA